jgi:glycosyltransferase involved in cell wall biosynthesis
VVYPALPFIKSKIKEHTETSFKKNNQNYLLYVGRQDPYKNLIRLIQAFNLIKVENIYSGKLIIAGKKDHRYNDAEKEVSKLKLQDTVIFLDFVDSQTLNELYTNCDFAIQPSIAEGFGLTAFEPFLHNKLCIFSKIPPFIEGFGQQMIFFDPYNISEIKNAIIKTLNLNKDDMAKMIITTQNDLKKFSPVNAVENWLKIWEN